MHLAPGGLAKTMVLPNHDSHTRTFVLVGVHQHQIVGKAKRHGRDRCLKARCGVKQIETGVLRIIGRVQLPIPAESQPHHGVTAHELDELGCLPRGLVDAVQHCREGRRVHRARHAEHVPVAIKGEVHEELWGARRTDRCEGSGGDILRKQRVVMRVRTGPALKRRGIRVAVAHRLEHPIGPEGQGHHGESGDRHAEERCPSSVSVDGRKLLSPKRGPAHAVQRPSR